MKRFNILMSIILLFLLCSFIIVIIVNQNLVFELNGKDTITLNVNSNYIEDGFTARVFKTDLSKYVQIKDKVDYSKIGTYSINYYLTYMGRIEMRTRTINIIDN